MNITKVVFTPKRKAPLNCQKAEYFVSSINWDEAIKKASEQLKKDNKLWYYYRDAIATTIKVL
jgi:hypothetical protein